MRQLYVPIGSFMLEYYLSICKAIWFGRMFCFAYCCRNKICVVQTPPLRRKICAELPPTPSKFHYIFNLRDLSRIIHGMCITVPDRIEVSLGILNCNRC